MPPIPLGIHAGLWGFDWSPASAERAIASAANAGYDLIEIPAVDRTVNDSAVTRRLLEQYGISATVSLALDFGTDINSTNAQSSSRGEHRLREAVTFASEIGAHFVGGVVYSAMGRYLRLPTGAGRLNSLKVLRRVAELAAGTQIVLGIEYVNRYESNLLNSAGATVQFIEDLGVENAVVHLDTFHAHIEEPNDLTAVLVAGAHLGYVHASESHRGVLGTGSIDWESLIRGLIRANYAAPITVETFSSAVITDEQAIEIGLWNPSWTDPDEVAAHSIAFLQRHLANATASSPLVA